MNLKRFQFPVLMVVGALIGYVAATANLVSEQNINAAPTEVQFADDSGGESTVTTPCCADGLNKKMQLTRSAPTQLQQGLATSNE